ncbi:M20 family metallopeptidase [Neobacillus sp. YIM B02564]|uniref:M20 family metallopeptidase n=1 Tax=Neobacillus paridis TaxID=2803862 RepID=A0ABS1TTT8_9BACI|nr:M20 family metallopeptidase [Neobacillus paridis]MBL4954727.1 M20 family metallopeptidase [Neobacillus paridis]
MTTQLADVQTYFDSEELIQIVSGLIRQKSENPLETEEEAARFVYNLLVREGIEAELSWAAPGRPNVIARIKGSNPTGPTLLYNGHLDVVPAGEGWSMDPFAAIIQDGKLYGRGAADMKSGVAAMIYAAMMLKRMGNPFSGELILFFNVDEERVNIGMKQFLKEDISADYAIISEPTELDICIAHKGVGRYRLVTQGVPGHAAAVKEPDNAICKMAKLISSLEQTGREVKKRVHPLLGPGSLTVTQIKGGTAANIVPGYCEIEIDRRVIPGDTRESVLEELNEVIGKTAKDNGFDYELIDYLFIPASYIPQDHSLVHGLLEVSRSIQEKDPEVKIFEATCEAPFLSVDKGIPTVICGPGSLKQAHITDEFVEIKQIVKASRIYIDLVMHLLKN